MEGLWRSKQHLPNVLREESLMIYGSIELAIEALGGAPGSVLAKVSATHMVRISKLRGKLRVSQKISLPPPLPSEEAVSQSDELGRGQTE